MNDLPARILRIATRSLRGDRSEWGAAMTAELAQLHDRNSRWRFALGSTRAILFAPLHPNAPAPGVTIAVTFLAGAAGCLAATWYVLAAWPHAAADISRVTAITFGVALILYLLVALRPPYILIAHGDAARRGAVIGFGLFLVVTIGRTIIDAVVPPSSGDGILGIFLMLTVTGTLTATGFLHSRGERSFAAGLTASLWAGLTASILNFNMDMLALLTRFELDTHMRHSMPGYYSMFTQDAFLSRHVGGHLASAMEGLRTHPIIALVFGSIGARIGSRRRPSADRALIRA